MMPKTAIFNAFVALALAATPLTLLQADDFATQLKLATSMINPRQFVEATLALHELEKTAAADREKADVTAALLNLYAARANDAYNRVYSLVLSRMDTVADAKRIEYAKKLLACPGVTTGQKLAAYADLAHTLGLESQFYEAVVNEKPDFAAHLKKENLTCLADYAALDPENTEVYLLQGDAYLAETRLDEAEAAYTKALAAKKPVAWMQGGAAQMGLAAVALARGDKSLALKLCREIAANGQYPAIRNTAGATPALQARELIEALDPFDLDALKLPVDTAAKVFPTAKQAAYTDTFAPLPAVKLVIGKGIPSNDARLELLTVKFRRFGIAIDEQAPFEIRLSVVGLGKPEGYTLSVRKEAATVRGHDAQGLLWGIVSLIQLVDQENKTIRLCDIADWPDCPVRGFNGTYFYGNLEFMLFHKLNSIVSSGPATDQVVPTACDYFVTQQYVRQFPRFGIRIAIGGKKLTMAPLRPLTNPLTLEHHKRFFGMIAEAGGHAAFHFDDIRFPAHPSDIRKAGTMANLDAKYLTALYRALREKHPSMTFIFCPPFYWGPDGGASQYPEAREPYLKSLGAELEPGIEVFWTGPRVKGYEKTKDHVAWITGLIRRKPLIWQNAPGPRADYTSYITDEIRLWPRCHYDGFLDDTTGFHANGGVPRLASVLATMADWTWNTNAYDPARSVREAVSQLFGKEMFAILEPGAGNLAVLDEFAGKVTPAFVANLDRYERCIARAEEAFEKAKTANPRAMELYSEGYQLGLDVAKRMLAEARKNPDFHAAYKEHIAITEKQARREIRINEPAGDMLITPIDMHGGKLFNASPKPLPTRRFAAVLYGKESAHPKTALKFECDPFPPEGPYELYLCGQDDELDGSCMLRVTLNGKVVFETNSVFESTGWKIQKIELPFDTLKRYNEVMIENGNSGESVTGPPFVLLNYAVIKAAK